MANRQLPKNIKTFNEITKKHNSVSALTDKVDQKYIDDFITESNKFNSEFQTAAGNAGYTNASSYYKDYSERLKKLKHQQSQIKAYLYNNRKKLNEKEYNDFVKSLDDTISNGYKQVEWLSGIVGSTKNFNSEEEYNKAAETSKQYYDNWGFYADESDFDEYTTKGANIENPTLDEAEGWMTFFGHAVGGKKIGNIVTYSRDNYNQIALGDLNMANMQGDQFYNEMTDDEVNVYNYLLAKYGEDKASEYIDYIKENLNARSGYKYAEGLKSMDNGIAKSTGYLAASIAGGLDQYGSGVKQLTTDEKVDTSSMAFTNQAILDDLDGFSKSVYQAGNVVGNMLPSIAVSYLTAGFGAPAIAGQALGSATVSLSAGGNAYTQGLADGMTKDQARTYAICVGASEGALQYAIGGIGALGAKSNIVSKILKKTSTIDNAFLRIATKGAISIGSEITEEELQNYLEPAFRAIITGEDYDAPTIQELLETAIVTALSTGVLEGPSTITNDVKENRYYKDLYGEKIEDLVSESLEIDPNNEYAQKIKELMDNGEEISGYQMGNLVKQNDAAMTAQDITKIETEAANRLAELGETENVEVVSKALAKQAKGEKLNSTEKNIIKNSKYGERVSNELNAEKIKSGKYASGWAQKLGTNRINPDEYGSALENAQVETDTDTQNTAVDEVTALKANVPALTTNAQNTQEIEAVKGIDGQVKNTETEETKVTLESASEKYGNQSKAMIHTYKEGQDIEKYDTAYKRAYDMGRSGVSLDYVNDMESVAYLTESQRSLAYEAGVAASEASANRLSKINSSQANGKTGRKIGTVTGKNVSISDLTNRFNDIQKISYKVLSNIAAATGIDIVLYKSTTDSEGNFKGEQGSYDRNKPGTIYIDINAGLKNIKSVNDFAKYAMLRTFSHEFMHFIEKWNPVEYNKFRKVVFDTLTERGENADKLIREKQAKTALEYEDASREVVAEAMTDVLPGSKFIETLANEHKTIFDKLHEKLKEFVANVKEYFNTIGENRSKEANALKEQVEDTLHYLDNIVKMFDKIAIEAVENYQKTVATETDVTEKSTKEISKKEKVNTKKQAQPTNETNATETEELHETVTEQIEQKSTEQTQPYISENGYIINDNTEYNSIEIEFNEKPSKTIREVLKANKFKWHKEKNVWYGYTSKETISNALDESYKTDNNSEVTNQEIQNTEPTNETNVTATEESISAEQEIEKEIIEEQTAEQNYNEKTPNNKSNTEVIDNGERDLGIQEQRTNEEAIRQDNSRPVRTSDSNGQGTTRLLDEFQTEDVSGISERGGTTENVTGDRGGLERNGNRTDTEIGDSRGERSSESEDLRRADVLSTLPESLNKKFEHSSWYKDSDITIKEFLDKVIQLGKSRFSSFSIIGEAKVISKKKSDKPLLEFKLVDKENNSMKLTEDMIEYLSSNSEKFKNMIDEFTNQHKAEELHKTVIEQIEQKSTETPKGSNYVIGDSLNIPNGEKARFKANIDAIKLIKQLESEKRNATATEQEILSKYVGWGGLSNAFGELMYNYETRKSEMTAKKGWENEFSEFKKLVDEGIITEEEYKAASASTKNAHYTSVEVIKAMYAGLSQLGFNGGRMLEPSSGVGNFVGAMPTNMSSKVNSWTMVELDNITGLIAKHLYPKADVRIQGFEKANLPDNYMDVAIGNVPFGDYGVVDRAYPKRITKTIHNYFFAKTLDKVRPGGIVMYITSSFTMNSENSEIRQYIMDRADLLGAIRLPNNAFSDNAGTQVVTDILILKKRAAGTKYAGETFLESPYKNYGKASEYAYINEYFDNHPEMVLGTPETVSGRYGADSLTYKPLEGKGTLGEQITEAFKNINAKMDYPTKLSPEKTNFKVEKETKKTKKSGYARIDGKIYRRVGTELEQIADSSISKRVDGLLTVKEAYNTLVNYIQQGQAKELITKARKDLNAAYDKFVKENGYINSRSNKSAIADDPDCFSIYALENYDTENKIATKSDIFTKDTINSNITITHVDDIETGIIVSMNTTGGIDTEFISKLTGENEKTVIKNLIDNRLAFKKKDGSFEIPELYLSGNVRAKLKEAESLVPFDKDFENNVEELKKVIPKDIPYHDIYVTPGTPWIPNAVYADFIAYMLGGSNSPNKYNGPDIEINRINNVIKIIVNNNRLKTRYQNTQEWGTKRRTFLNLIEAMLVSRTINVNDSIEDINGKKKSVINKVETAAAQAKAEEITKKFQEWLWQDENRRKELSLLYNETFNALVTPKYNGKNLSVNGLNANYSLREHQANAVQRIITSGGNTLLAHKVGAGKTLEMASAAMKLKELGIVKKPMFAVPKSIVGQWGIDFKDYFPAAKILVANDKSFSKDNRKIFINNIMNGDFDAVILSYEQLAKISMSAEFQEKFYQEQIDEIISAIAEEKAETKGKGLTVKDMEKKKSQLEKKIEELKLTKQDEDNVNFEKLGIDSLFIDEAHNFKNLQYITKMTNVSGLGNSTGTKRAFDLYTKIRYLQELNGGRGIVFATATPVMNSMAEMYIMQKYLQSDMLKQLGINSFDAWAKQFGEIVNSVEINPSGQGFRVKQTFSNFKNLNELQLLFRSFSDVLTDVPGLEIPKMKGGKVKTIVCQPGQFQINYMSELQERAENIKNVDAKVDNMLKITSDGRKVSYTQRMIDPTLPYEPGCKVFSCCEKVFEEYKDSEKIKGTQIIFCDMATPKGKKKDSKDYDESEEETEIYLESAKLYDDMKAYLVKKGIPANEIAFIHDAKNDNQKIRLFKDVNDGTVRVLIGSTGKMGVGMNAQKRIVAIHHLDAPWRPGDVEQRDGRAFRQKNMNKEVSKYTYVTEKSFDARLWDILDRKSHFINQIMSGEDVGRSAEDTGNVTLSAAEVKALASGNPLIQEEVELTNALINLEYAYKAYNSSILVAKNKMVEDTQQIVSLKSKIENAQEDIKSRTDTYSDGKFSMTINGNKFTDKKDAGIALFAAISSKAVEDKFVTIGKFANFDISVIKQKQEYVGSLVGKNGYHFNVYTNSTTQMINRMCDTIRGIEESIATWNENLVEAQKDLEAQEKLSTQPFAKQEEINQKRARHKEIMDILNPPTEQDLYDDEETQEQSREYLDDVQYQQRTETLSDRDVLEIATDNLLLKDLEQDENGLTEGQKEALEIFKNKLTKLKKLQEERRNEGRLYHEQQFGSNIDKEAAQKTYNRMKILDEKINKTNIELLSIEKKEVLMSVLKEARQVIKKNERAHGDEILKRWQDRRNNAVEIQKLRDRIKKNVEELSSWATNPNNKTIIKHIPDAINNTVIPFIESINLTSKKQLTGGDATAEDKLFVERLQALKGAMKTNIDVYGLYSGYNDLPSDFMENLQTFIDTTQTLVENSKGKYVVNEMTLEELDNLSSLIVNLKAHITQMNKFHNESMFKHVAEAGDNSIEHFSQFKPQKNTGGVSNFLFWQQMRPAYAFERFGKGGMAIYDGLRKGQAKLGFNAEEIIKFTGKTYTEEEVKKWEETVKTIELSNGDTVKMTISQIMGLYKLNQQNDSNRHMLKSGIRVATFKNDGKKISDLGHLLTEADVEVITSELTPRQKDVADSLQRYMAKQGAEWGNYISVARFGEEQYGNPQYYPINSDGRHLDAVAAEKPNEASLYALLNMSFTKKRNELANNRIVIYSIFDVFSNHMASMAQYNAMALPILDALKWFNYKQVEVAEDGTKTTLDSVREQMARVYGVPEEKKPGSGKQSYAETFFSNIIKDFSGTGAQGTPYDNIGTKSIHAYNVAQVAYNFRVVVQQPLAITRAGMVIDYKSIIKGMKLDPSEIKKNTREMLEYSGIAVWKSLGFYDVNISRGLSSLIKHNETVMNKITEFGMWGAEKADTLTWSWIWSACKEEVKTKQKIKQGDAGFYEAVTKLFEDVIYKTQVVDSVLTKNEFMRDKSAVSRLIGSFMSEATATASTALSAYDKYNHDIMRGMAKKKALKRNMKNMARTAYVYGLSAVLLAAVQAVVDSPRDDDDYGSFFEKWLKAFKGNVFDELMPLNKIPLVSDFYEVAEKLIGTAFNVDVYANPPQTILMQWYDSLIKGAEIVRDKLYGVDTNYTWYGGIFKLLQAASGAVGLPMASVTRAIITGWNAVIGASAPSLKVKGYEATEENAIKYAYQDGYLTEEEATAELLKKGIIKKEEDAYFIFQEWDYGFGYSKYDDVLEAVRNGENIDEAMEELTSHGVDEKEVYSNIKTEIGKWYQDGEITKQQAISMLEKYRTDMESDEITEQVNKWSAKVVTGIAYEEIRDKYIDGEITDTRAKQMITMYGGKTEEEAANLVQYWKFKNDNPDLDWQQETVTKYYSDVADSGISVEVYDDYLTGRKDCTGTDLDGDGKTDSGSKKVEILEVIDSLPISNSQKDKLYRLNGWSEKTIWEAPWR